MQIADLQILRSEICNLKLKVAEQLQLKPGVKAVSDSGDTPLFPSLRFPGRVTLYPHEVALKIGCSEDHIFDLISEGKLRAVDITGKNNLSNRRCLRIPVEAWDAFVRENTI